MENSLAPEFQFIRNYIKRLAGKGALDLTDDAALLSVDPAYELVLTADAMVENVHFFTSDPVDFIAQKLLRCNLSDLAGMGAEPVGYLLTVSLPKHCFNPKWFEQFTNGLAKDQKMFNISLLGGDTTYNPHNMVFSLTALGKVKKNKALRRNNAKVGDGIWVTGTIGDAALGLLALQNEINDVDDFLTQRYHLPQPRLGLQLTDIANAGMDISDGLIQDLGHLTRESQLGAIIFANQVPLSNQAKQLGSEYLETCLTGGDDYELMLTIPKEKEDQALIESQRTNIPLTKIGYCTDKRNSLICYDKDKNIMNFKQNGWSHI
ncbi:Thiamine monophosphate kinase (ThiL) (PDB:5CC8) [Commensalibacter communis]|uniref:Thiamine-monophosphate kinase n=1 Tax=Commensalibacter communis TaxID=2972786 RepID=A0A9W4TNF0_9PROT|nr:thiamine-phosphate kinase [Commensalibacter communis]CAI3928051.1 Thiamine monophosphate kinase (ThiL) (PDB:5CC8) [Commensalibacter communis]CAI3928623.1 Thiamine monophosphate kinase (ThiL) (PDB:5CC8) [Commensalibacter communis]CAI3932822.1 Thiamine monophosphate kinase (ThiL) (PDB:5CC8) [Commensalibacter communis]CAI3934375.1 Thiamine monophosphate kinase (ThiL) (PDB:5CC8) [Commensalibacter communis]